MLVLLGEIHAIRQPASAEWLPRLFPVPSHRGDQVGAANVAALTDSPRTVCGRTGGPGGAGTGGSLSVTRVSECSEGPTGFPS